MRQSHRFPLIKAKLQTLYTVHRHSGKCYKKRGMNFDIVPDYPGPNIYLSLLLLELCEKAQPRSQDPQERGPWEQGFEKASMVTYIRDVTNSRQAGY